MPRAAQVLAPGGRQEVAAERVDVDRELAGRLARVEQVREAGLARDCADSGRRVDEAALGRDPRDRDQARRGRRSSAQRVDRELAVTRRRGPPRRARRCAAPTWSIAMTLLAYSDAT